MPTDADRVTAAIRYLDTHVETQPRLADIARAADLSAGHFQRLFKRWAGVSPKRFLQYATAAHARSLLAEGQSVLDASLRSGLSGPGRLHDLTVGVHAMTPGEVARRGADVLIRHGVHDGPVGRFVIGVTERGICHLAFIGDEDATRALEALRRAWPQATHRADHSGTRTFVDRIFAGDRHPPPTVLCGTNFQIRVWEALLQIPEGHLVSYGALAAALGMPRAARAVGNAVAQNSIAWLIPCHRVIRSTGAFGRYRWDPARKRMLIGYESARRAGRQAIC